MRVSMKKNPIRKIHVGWAHSWVGGVRPEAPTSVRKWVGVCPECNEIVKSAPYGMHYDTKNTRKSAKDALHYHMLRKH